MCSLSCLTEVNDASLERVALQDREPVLDLIEPGSTGRGEVEMHVGVTLEPAVARLATPSAAPSTIRARWRSRYSVLVERANASSSLRSTSVSMIGVASGMPFMHP